jgi:hypothetical protein
MIAPPGRRPMTFRPVMLTVTPRRELRCLLIPSSFDGEHAFQLELLSTAGCRLLHTERFSGLLVGLMGGSWLDVTRDGKTAWLDRCLNQDSKWKFQVIPSKFEAFDA